MRYLLPCASLGSSPALSEDPNPMKSILLLWQLSKPGPGNCNFFITSSTHHLNSSDPLSCPLSSSNCFTNTKFCSTLLCKDLTLHPFVHLKHTQETTGEKLPVLPQRPKKVKPSSHITVLTLQSLALEIWQQLAEAFLESFSQSLFKAYRRVAIGKITETILIYWSKPTLKLEVFKTQNAWPEIKARRAQCFTLCIPIFLSCRSLNTQADRQILKAYSLKLQM